MIGSASWCAFCIGIAHCGQLRAGVPCSPRSDAEGDNACHRVVQRHFKGYRLKGTMRSPLSQCEAHAELVVNIKSLKRIQHPSVDVMCSFYWACETHCFVRLICGSLILLVHAVGGPCRCRWQRKFLGRRSSFVCCGSQAYFVSSWGEAMRTYVSLIFWLKPVLSFPIATTDTKKIAAEAEALIKIRNARWAMLAFRDSKVAFAVASHSWRSYALQSHRGRAQTVTMRFLWC